MQAKLVTRVANQSTFFWKRVQGVAGDEKGGFDLVLVEHFHQARNSDLGGKDPSRDVVWRVFASIRACRPCVSGWIAASGILDHAPSQPATQSRSIPSVTRARLGIAPSQKPIE